jgi:hypothetical protein
MKSRLACALWMIAALAHAPSLAHAQDTTARDRVSRAVERFEAALTTTDPDRRRRELESALAELEEANRLDSETLIEWNLARVEQELGRPVAALEHVERFLASVPADHPRRAAAEALASSLRTRVASVWIDSPVVGARVSIEGELRGTTPLDHPLRVPAGEVTITLGAPGYREGTRRIRVAGETETRVRIELELEATALGEVRVQSALLDVQITIDDQVRGTTPLPGSAALTPGTHVLIAERVGYRRLRRTIDVELGAEQTIDVTLEPDPDATLATLTLQLPRAHAAASIDGARVDLDSALRLPEGRHALALEVEERDDWSGVVTLAAGAELVETPPLEWHDDAFARRHDGAELQRIAGATVVAAGASAFVAGVVLILVAALDTDPSEASTRAQYDTCHANPACGPLMLNRLGGDLAYLDALGTLEYGLGAGLAIAGAAATAVGLWLTLDAPSDERIRAAAHAALRLGPASIELMGAF